MKAVILIGVSGSGKSTRAKHYTDAGWIRVERDIVRREIVTERLLKMKPPVILKDTDNFWKYWNFKWEDKVTEACQLRIEYAASADISIVISDTNLTKNRRDALTQKLQNLGFQVELEVIGRDLSLEQLWKRDAQRVDTVGHAIVAEQYSRFRKEFPLYALKDTLGLRSAVIFDVDGTLAHHEGIRSPYEWHKVHLDNADEIVWNSLVSQKLAGNEIIILSGRDEVCRYETTEWLNYHYNVTLHRMGFNLSSPLAQFEFGEKNVFMRPENDQRSDVIIKEELFFNNIDGQYKIEAVFDDRPKVCRGWYEFGFKVVHCANPYIEF